MLWEGLALKGFSRQQLETTGFSFVMSKLEPCCCYGEEKKREVDWFSREEMDHLDSQLNQLCETVRFHRSQPEQIHGIRRYFAPVQRNPGKIVRKLEGEVEVLDEVELFDLKNFALDMQYLCSAVEKTGITLGSLVRGSTQAVIRLLIQETR